VAFCHGETRYHRDALKKPGLGRARQFQLWVQVLRKCRTAPPSPKLRRRLRIGRNVCPAAHYPQRRPVTKASRNDRTFTIRDLLKTGYTSRWLLLLYHVSGAWTGLLGLLPFQDVHESPGAVIFGFELLRPLFDGRIMHVQANPQRVSLDLKDPARFALVPYLSAWSRPFSSAAAAAIIILPVRPNALPHGGHTRTDRRPKHSIARPSRSGSRRGPVPPTKSWPLSRTK
jgi:hypothetical protein